MLSDSSAVRPGSSSDHPEVNRSRATTFPFLLVLFFGSGCAALIYEIVWFQLLQFVVGSSAISLGVLLGTFMGGMCLGSLLLPRLVSKLAHPLRVYAWLEIGIGLIGICVPFLLPFLDRVYALSAAASGLGIGGRIFIAVVVLLPPTLFMGATLPAIGRWVDSTPKGVSRLGFFYGGNTAGAVAGSLLAGFYLLRVYDLATATCVAVAINFAVGAAAFFLARRTQSTSDDTRPTSLTGLTPAPIGPPAEGFSVYVTIGFSGLCALGAEVIWTRLLSLLLGGTVYTFSIILAVFLLGLGLGSSVGSTLARRLQNPQLALGVCQLMVTLGVAWAAYAISVSLPYWPVDPMLTSSPWLNFQFDFVRCLFALLPAACLWGASFPLALAAVSRPAQDAGITVARVYAANTVGAIVGAVGFSVFGLASLGTQVAQQVLIVLSAGGALLMFVATKRAAAERLNNRPRSGVSSAMMVVVTLLVGLFLAHSVQEIPWGVIAYGRNLPRREKEIREKRAHLLFVGEGMNSSVAVTELASGVRNFHVSGKVEASSDSQDMRLQLMLGHLPALIHPHPKSVLIVGCGAGVTAGTFVLHPGIERIVICEIEPLIPRVVARYFAPQNNHVVDDKRVEIHYDDARHFILTTKEKFDIITSDPIHPWVKGAATLYSLEYFELCQQRLNPGGLITQWVPLYESSSEVVKSEVATFFKVFPLGEIWGNSQQGSGYDVVVMGHRRPLKIDVDALQDRLDQPAYWPVSQALGPLSLGSAVALLGTYAGRASDLGPWMKNAEINRDRSLRLQYLAGMELNAFASASIYRELLEFRRYPSDIFTVSGDRERLLKLELRTASEPETPAAPPVVESGDVGP